MFLFRVKPKAERAPAPIPTVRRSRSAASLHATAMGEPTRPLAALCSQTSARGAPLEGFTVLPMG
jgi:hypothetical protein